MTTRQFDTIMNNSSIRLGLIQHTSPPGESKETILARAITLIRDAAGQGAQLIATQELFISHYFCQYEDEQYFDLAEPIPGPTSNTLCELARELKVEITASLFEKRAPGVFHNTSILIDSSGNIVGKYRKMHIPHDPRFFEKYYFTPGDSRDESNNEDTGFHIHRSKHADIGMLICWDQWFPEAARVTALRGAQILFYPTAIGWIPEDDADYHHQQREAWQTMQRAHAIANGVYVAAINRVGTEGEIMFYGSSFVADPFGQIIAQADETSEQTLVVDCDLSLIDTFRKQWPFLRDRRIDAYHDLTRRVVD